MLRFGYELLSVEVSLVHLVEDRVSSFRSIPFIQTTHPSWQGEQHFRSEELGCPGILPETGRHIILDKPLASGPHFCQWGMYTSLTYQTRGYVLTLVDGSFSCLADSHAKLGR